MKTIKVGTRGSALALTQTQQTIDALKTMAPDKNFETIIIQTKGDLNQNTALDKFGDKGIFVQEIETQLLEGKIDIAVHSMKDMPSEVTKGLAFANPPKRQDPRDLLITKEPLQNPLDLPLHAVVGTGSKRRLYQLQKLRPDLKFVPIRGNVDTRLKKLETENYDAIILAAAGLKRLGIFQQLKNAYLLPVDMMLPAPAQGALAIQYRENDHETKRLLESISDKATTVSINAERQFLKAVEGGCHAPMGAYAEIQDNGMLKLSTVFGDDQGKKLYYASEIGSTEEAEKLGDLCATRILSQMKSKGHVVLLGAGPGDMDLITVKGLKAIESCDAIVYDRLASPQLLNRIPSHAAKYYVGKASGNHFYTQDETNQLLVTLATQGKKVVRLKGGDPYVFGRGGEEGEVLRAAGVSFEVVPGISSSIAGLNYAGIPITHRDFASSFHVFTAHFKDDDSSLDFKTISQLEGTLVFLMGIANMHKIADNLLKNGKNPKTPVAMISKATTLAQKTFISTLENTVTDLPNDMAYSPALFVVGEVIQLRETLNWFETQPLFGTTTLVSRSLDQASKLEHAIQSKGGKTFALPLLHISPCDFKKQLIDTMGDKTLSHIWFTSENAVHTFMKGLDNIGKDARALSACKVLAIGTATAKVLSTYGIKADEIPETFTQEGIMAHMTGKIRKTDHILLPQGNLARPDLANWIKEHCSLTVMITYETLEKEHDKETIEKVRLLLENEAILLPFTSSSTATHFHNFCSKHDIKIHDEAKIFAIGPTTERTLSSLGYSISGTALEHNINGLVDTILKETSHETL